MGLFDFLKKGKEEPAKPQSNIQGKSNVQTPSGTQPVSKGTDVTSRQPGQSDQTTTPGAHSDVYTVQSGDSLSKIAKKHYGNANAWTKIYNANKSTIGENPDLIRPGQRLNIPRD